MITLVTGGSGSGKSEYAEELVLGSGRSWRFYVATMQVYGKEGEDKVRRHRHLRSGKGFVTLERPGNVGAPLPGMTGCRASDSVILLECVSNLAANEMFGAEDTSGAPLDAGRIAARILKDIRILAARARDMVIVTNQVGEDGLDYQKETLEYIRLMGILNRELAGMSDNVVEVVWGIPVILKGKNTGRTREEGE